MLSVNLLERHFESRRFDRILDGVADNGLNLPLPLRIRLSQSPVSSAALGLSRLVELTYGPTPLSRAMTRFLMESQEPDGSFGFDPLTTATVVAALGKLIQDHPASVDDSTRTAHEHAIAALAAMQDESGLFAGHDDRSDEDRALVSAFILLILRQDDLFRSSIRLADLLDWFEDREGRLDPATAQLWRMTSLTVGDQPAGSQVPSRRFSDVYACV